ncbi:beta and gamma crystallin [Caballeronia novacaledonica]|uniref:Beta and gamma crystallin n=1 Tax=Caballeronia novacaledonica TaxID=1544861 RepID=A0A2U3I342_9BURK|nr:beta-1,3-glucanase family protein [Caballeronia novacaledonica]SPB14545.1 beta and gamma crystallin [Caballeronia novacaledonica]
MTTKSISRRTFLLGMGASGLLAACGGGSGSGSGPASASAGPASPSAPQADGTQSTAKTPLTLDLTQTDLPAGTAVYAYVIGETSLASGVTQYWIDSTGTPHVMSAADNTIAAKTFPGSSALPASEAAALAETYPLAWADYSIPLTVGSRFALDLSKLNATTIPGLGTGTAAFSGRIYLSVGVPKLPFTPLSSSAYTAPVTVGGPGALTLFDWIEFSFDSQGNFNGNTTQVDQFGFPLFLDGTPGGSQQGQYNTSRPAIIEAVSKLPAAFYVPQSVSAPSAFPAGLAVNGSVTLRALSPKSISAQNQYSGSLLTYFDQTIENWYLTWAATPLSVTDLATGTYTGIVKPGAGLTFYAGSTASGTAAFTVGGAGTPGISSLDVWQCANALATGSDAAKNVQKMLAAAFNRGVMANTLADATCKNDAATFYQITHSNTLVFNPWAQLFHRLSTNSLAYAFPYDDVCDQNPSIGLAATQSVTITLGKFFS